MVLDILNIEWISIILMIIGSFGIILLVKPIDKLIMFSILEAGFILAVVAFKYLDVALVISLFAPITTVIFLLSMVKLNDIRKRNLNEGDTLD